MSHLPYRPAWWVPGPHAQTLWGKLARRIHPVQTRIERWDTPDGDFIEMHRLDAVTSKAVPSPRVLILHGLEGSVRSHYVQGLLKECERLGWAADLLVFRSCGAELNRARRFYHSGETTDLAMVVDKLLGENSEQDLAIVGVSLGGNVLLKYLGERGNSINPRIRAAAAVSVPFDLARGSKHISNGFSKVYERNFLDSLKRKVREKMLTFPDLIDSQAVESVRTLYDFDNMLTAPVHGFRDADDYYAQSSAIKFIGNVNVSTLLLSAVDDPFLPPDVLDEVRMIAQRNRDLHVEFVAKGGHAGFVSGVVPWSPIYYLERRVVDFFQRHFLSQ